MYCFNCMRDAERGGICPYCGKINKPVSISHHLAPGTVLNEKYLIGNAIGEGGFGITYVGRDVRLNMRVAVKEYFPSGKANRNSEISGEVYTSTESQREFFEKGKERFLQEARSLARFSSEEGVVSVKNYFEENNTAYIIMDYLEGETLLSHVKNRGRFTGEQIFRLMLPVMKTLRKIHSENIIHRDISPDNIIYQKNGALVLTDFGSARYFTNKNSEMSVMLKQGYAPEEQYRSDGNQGPWTDVYGLCATMYKCITGVTPVGGLDRIHADTLRKPSSMGAAISTALEAVLMYGLAVSPKDRCRDMSELIDLTENALGKHETGSEPPTSEYERRRPANTPRPKTYGDFYEKSGDAEEFPAGGKKQKEQSKKGLIIGVSAAAAILVIAGLILLFIFMPKGGDKSEKKPLVTTQVVTTAEPTTEEPTEKIITVPDVSGKTKGEAIRLITDEKLDYELELEETENLSEENKVLWQSPESGSEVREGETVTLFIGQYKAPVTEKPTEIEETFPTGAVIYYCCANEYAVMRDISSAQGSEIARISSREPVEYLNTVGEFYHVKYKGQTGYVLSVCFSEDINAPLYFGTGEEVAVGNLSPGIAVYSHSSGSVNICSEPTSAEGDYVIGAIPSGEKAYYLESTYGKKITTGVLFSRKEYDDTNRLFYKVQFNGIEGYVLAQYFSTAPLL